MVYSNGIPRPVGMPLRARARDAGWPPGVTAGVLTQPVVLGGLAATAGLGVAGWLAGMAVALATGLLLAAGLRRGERADLGPADRVTLARTVLVGGVTALVVEGLTGPVPAVAVVAPAAVALVLDGVDGRVARRTGTASTFGARFDMEVDAFLILVLSVHLVAPLGAWVLAIGGMRYAFVLAGAVWPWLCGPLPPLFARKAVAAVQGVVLAVASAGMLPPAGARAAVGAALAALVWSFGRDTVGLARRRPVTRRG